jgi:hypothetical protein
MILPGYAPHETGRQAFRIYFTKIIYNYDRYATNDFNEEADSHGSLKMRRKVTDEVCDCNNIYISVYTFVHLLAVKPSMLPV